MNEIYKYDWGQPLVVSDTAPDEMQRGAACSVCGIRKLNEEVLYLVEFSDGYSLEISEKHLKKHEDR